jgi:DNA-directed RNA polymerase specialized sigma24 family protein
MTDGAAELKALFNVISHGDKKAFDALFNNYYVLLTKFACSYLKQEDDADEVVSELFVRLWLKRMELDKINNPKVYLYVSVKNACLNSGTKASDLVLWKMKVKLNRPIRVPGIHLRP